METDIEFRHGILVNDMHTEMFKGEVYKWL